MTILLRILVSTYRNIIRHGLVSTAGILIITLLFLILNGLIFANLAQQSALALVNQKLDLALHFQTEPDTFQIDTMRTELASTFPAIRSTTFISSDTAFKNFLTNFATENPTLSRWIQGNTSESPLPATLVIAADPALHAPIIDWLSTSRFARMFDLASPDSSQLAITAAHKILTIDSALTRLSWVTGIVFGTLAALIIMAVLRLTILSRSTEITISLLVGATPRFVRLPFIFEGIFFGIAASSLGVGVFTLLLTQFDLAAVSAEIYGGLGELLTLASTGYLENIGLILGWQMLIAILLGCTASLLATHRYLRRELILD